MHTYTCTHTHAVACGVAQIKVPNSKFKGEKVTVVDSGTVKGEDSTQGSCAQVRVCACACVHHWQPTICTDRGIFQLLSAMAWIVCALHVSTCHRNLAATEALLRGARCTHATRAMLATPRTHSYSRACLHLHCPGVVTTLRAHSGGRRPRNKREIRGGVQIPLRRQAQGTSACKYTCTCIMHFL